jgi:hypothetical protein
MKEKILGLVLSGLVVLSASMPAMARSGDNAPDSANFVLTSPNTDLPNSSVLTPGDNVTISTANGVTTVTAVVPDVSQLKNLTFTVASDPSVFLSQNTLTDVVLLNAALNGMSVQLPGPETMTNRVVTLKRVDDNTQAVVTVTVSGYGQMDNSQSRTLSVFSTLRLLSIGNKYIVL